MNKNKLEIQSYIVQDQQNKSNHSQFTHFASHPIKSTFLHLHVLQTLKQSTSQSHSRSDSQNTLPIPLPSSSSTSLSYFSSSNFEMMKIIGKGGFGNYYYYYYY